MPLNVFTPNDRVRIVYYLELHEYERSKNSDLYIRLEQKEHRDREDETAIAQTIQAWLDTLDKLKAQIDGSIEEDFNSTSLAMPISSQSIQADDFFRQQVSYDSGAAYTNKSTNYSSFYGNKQERMNMIILDIKRELWYLKLDNRVPVYFNAGHADTMFNYSRANRITYLDQDMLTVVGQTGALTDGQSIDLDITIGTNAVLAKIGVDNVARIRGYSNAPARTADGNRDLITRPPDDIEAFIFDYELNTLNSTKAFSPAIPFINTDEIQSDKIYLRVFNLHTSPDPQNPESKIITVTLYYQINY